VLLFPGRGKLFAVNFSKPLADKNADFRSLWQSDRHFWSASYYDLPVFT
jgi:hypothetical protein